MDNPALGLEFIALFHHGTPDMIVQRIYSWYLESFNKPGQFACSQFCTTLERAEMGMS